MSSDLTRRRTGRVTPTTHHTDLGARAEETAPASDHDVHAAVDAAGHAWIQVFRDRGVWDLTPDLIDLWTARNQHFYNHLRRIAATIRAARGDWTDASNKSDGAVHALELGCGPGRHAIAMARLGLRVTALDLDPRITAQAKANTRRCGVGDRVTVEVADMDAYLDGLHNTGRDRPGAAVDVVTHGGLMEHFVDADAVRASIAKQARIARWVVFDVPTGSPKNLALFERDDIFRQDWTTQTWVEDVLAPFDIAAWDVETHTAPGMTDDLVVVLRGDHP